MSTLRKLQKMVGMVEGESITNLTRKELEEALSEVIEFLSEVNKKNRDEFSSVSAKLGQELSSIRQGLKTDVDRYKNDLSQAAGIRIVEGFRSRLESIEGSIQTRLAELKDGVDGVSPDIEEVVKKLIPHIPKGSPDTGIEIRNKLEHLEGDEKLSVDAIGGLEEKIKKVAPKGGSGGIIAHRLDQIGDVDMVTTPPTNGQVLAYDAANTKWVPSSAGAGTGDVTKVGTPANNQVGVWTGDGTIEGDAALTFDTATDTLATGIVTVTDDAYAAGWDTSTAVPTKNAVYDKIETLAPKASPTFTGTVTLPVALTGVIRADSGVVSVDTDVTDIVAAATDIAAGKVELATDAETVTGSATDRATTPANITARLAAPGAIGGTTAAAITGTTITANTGFVPDANDGAYLGQAGTAFSDLFLAEGGVINWDSGDATLTQTGNVVELAGADLTVPNLTIGAAGTITLSENASIALDPAGSADGKYSGITITGTAGADLAFGDLIYLAAADSRWEKTDADASATGGPVLIGMCVNDPSGDGQPVTVLLQGQIRADAKFPALTIGAPVYLGEAAGEIQTAIPTGADNVIRVVGFALTDSEIYFNPSQDHQISVA